MIQVLNAAEPAVFAVMGYWTAGFFTSSTIAGARCSESWNRKTLGLIARLVWSSHEHYCTRVCCRSRVLAVRARNGRVCHSFSRGDRVWLLGGSRESA